ncbi:MAG: conjugal transfer protein TraF [Candidatus Aenigmarchaeota archaeon]|nr:conjugal transfer protein TraF [Candidatus Aenigmarchaeota archaeon]
MTAQKQVKKLDAGLIVSAFVISGLIFAAGMFVGYGLNTEKLASIESNLNSINKDVQSFQSQFLFLDMFGEKASCPMLESTLNRISENSYDLGNRLSAYGAEGEIKDEATYRERKLEYSSMLTGYWLLAEKLKSACNMSFNTILYFYSGPCPGCEDQAFILTYMKNKYGDRVLVFALDADIKEPSVEALREYYNITEYPSLVINGKPIPGFVSQQQLEDTLNLGVVVGG